MPVSPTPTSYAVLGLLSVRSWTTYELAQQVRRSLSWFWPRAERKLYEEPKRLAARGWATATERYTGKRRSFEYAITEEGRESLRAWLAAPASPRTHEFEAMIKVFFADAGDLGSLRATLDGIHDEAAERVEALGLLAAEPNRVEGRDHISALTLSFNLEQELSVLRWAAWAREQVRTWADVSGTGWDAASVRRDLVRRALDAHADPVVER